MNATGGARNAIHDQKAFGREDRVPEPPFPPTSEAALARYRLHVLAMPEKLWVLASVPSLALQIAETEVRLNKMNIAMATAELQDWEGKMNPLIGAIAKHNTTLALLLSRLKALPASEEGLSISKSSIHESAASNAVERNKDNLFGDLISRHDN